MIASSADAAEPALLVDRLTRRYGDTLALDNVSLALAPGSALGLAGPNGGGKSTLLRIIATLERPTSGHVLIHGVDTAVDPGVARRLIGFAGPPAGAEWLTVAEDLDFAARLAGVSRADRASTIGAMLQLIDLADRRHRPLAHLSRGDRKRLSIARALLHDPEVLVLDDPFDGLDAGARLELQVVLAELTAIGKTLLVTAATLAELADVCPEVGLLDRGRLLFLGPFESVVAGGLAGRPLRLTVASDIESAEARLAAHPGVGGLVRLDDAGILFRLDGDAADQAGLTAALIAAGVAIVELAPAPDAAEAELTRLVRSER